MMVARTVAIDDAIREVAAPQVVILGAGLDGRAWRMPELRDAVVFEVDHPDSQRDKKQGVAQLSQLAREVRFTAVDFERDDLDAALAAAGHDPARPTTWVWEGVVMYLSLPDIEKTLGVIARRSAPRSRLIVVYHSPALTLKLVSWIVRRLGEPLRSVLRAEEMRALLARFGFQVARDEDLRTTAASLSPTVLRGTRFVGHMRTVVADKT
jgi:methyltransferase (TIGR00027 family)